MSAAPIATQPVDTDLPDFSALYEAQENFEKLQPIVKPILDQITALTEKDDTTGQDVIAVAILTKQASNLIAPPVQNVINKVEDMLRARGFFTEEFEQDVRPFNANFAQFCDIAISTATEATEIMTEGQKELQEQAKAELSARFSEGSPDGPGPLFPIINAAVLCCASETINSFDFSDRFTTMMDAIEEKDEAILLKSMEDFATGYREIASEINEVAPYLIFGAKIAQAAVKLPETKEALLAIAKDLEAKKEAAASESAKEAPL